MEEEKRKWIVKPAMWAALLTLLDLLFLLTIHIIDWIHTKYFLPLSEGGLWNILDSLIQLWNFLHLPIIREVQPILMPVITDHPPSPGIMVFFLFQALCLLQATIVGYAIGLMIHMGYHMRKDHGKRSLDKSA
ncbi:MAG: hypothetical protein FWC38_03390 [Proteobacteria bacterium]|nr:hypothetical protein [Pseudomonadota bacterium]MCL2307272.1 hypothetical protein [Pseudomonadota bacterium]